MRLSVIQLMWVNSSSIEISYSGEKLFVKYLCLIKNLFIAKISIHFAGNER